MARPVRDAGKAGTGGGRPNDNGLAATLPMRSTTDWASSLAMSPIHGVLALITLQQALSISHKIDRSGVPKSCCMMWCGAPMPSNGVRTMMSLPLGVLGGRRSRLGGGSGAPSVVASTGEGAPRCFLALPPALLLLRVCHCGC